jgi:4-amino-4-deoxy-L-arabinose transferase-like glycosyltransferase
LTHSRPDSLGARPRVAGFGLGCALAVGTAVIFWRLGAASLYSDEAYTLWLSAHAGESLIRVLSSQDYHPPLFYLAAHFAQRWLEWPAWDYRYLVAPFGLLTIAATWGAARRMFGDVTAALGALLVSLAPALSVYNRMFRMYAPFVALATLSWWLLLEAEAARSKMKESTQPNGDAHRSAARANLAARVLWVEYAGVCLALAFTHYLAFFVLASQAAYVVTRYARAKPALWAYLLVALAYVPWTGHLAQQLPLGALAEARPTLGAGLASSIAGAFAAGMPCGSFGCVAANWSVVGGVVAIIAASVWVGRRSALPFWLACFVLAVAASITLSRNFAYFPRYLLVDVPPVAIGLALIASTLLKSKATAAGWAVALGAAAFSIVGLFNVLLDPFYQFPDWYAVNAAMLEREKPGDAVILDAAYEYLVVADYSAFRGRTILLFMNSSDFKPIEQWITQHPARRIWYVEHQNYYWDPQLRIRSWLASRRVLFAQRFARRSPENEVTLVLFDKLPIKN